MPKTVQWMSAIPNALLQLHSAGPDGLIDRAMVQTMLSVEKRRANLIMREAGARDFDGRSLVIPALSLRLYLEKKGDPKAIQKERQRFREFQRKLGQMRQEFMANPPCHVEMPLAEARRLERGGFKGLPEGIELGPGRIEVRFENVQQAKEKLLALAFAMGKEEGEFEELVRVWSVA